MAQTHRTLVAVLVAIIAVLILVIAYTFLVSPRIAGYAVERQQEGIDYAVVNIAQVAAQCQQAISLPLGNQTINLVAVECFPDRFPELQNQTQQTEVPQ